VRFLLFDRVTHLEPGRRIEGVKCTSLTEEYLRGHFPRSARVPGSLLVESMVQLTAWCAIARHDYAFSLVLSVLEDVEVPCDLAPGCQVRLVGEISGTNPKASVGTAWAEVDGARVARIGRVLYAHVPAPDPDALRARLRYFGGTP
jgi:3-hydroxyacyl-[acyl-carrier-protein] dehydratase